MSHDPRARAAKVDKKREGSGCAGAQLRGRAGRRRAPPPPPQPPPP
eukprot:COSAG03_NODE_1930_length_3344_cov_1.757165_1_plen_45_part_10